VRWLGCAVTRAQEAHSECHSGGGRFFTGNEQASGPRCDTPSPGARFGTAVAFLSSFVPCCTPTAPALTCSTVEASGMAVPPPSIQQEFDGTAAAAAPSAPRFNLQVNVNHGLSGIHPGGIHPYVISVSTTDTCRHAYFERITKKRGED